jgi:hypothetical protein
MGTAWRVAVGIVVAFALYFGLCDLSMAQRGGRAVENYRATEAFRLETARQERAETFRLNERSFVKEVPAYFQADLMQAPPGGRPKVAYFLDPASEFGPGLRTMRSAAVGLEEIAMPANILATEFFRQNARQTVLLVGHIEGPDLVMYDHTRTETGRLNVKTLEEAADAHGSLLFVLGCRSFEAGATVGFSTDLSTSQVAEGLRAIAASKPEEKYGRTLYKLLRSLQRMADLKIDINFPSRLRTIFEFGNVLEGKRKIEVSLVDAKTGEKVVSTVIDTRHLRYALEGPEPDGGSVFLGLLIMATLIGLPIVGVVGALIEWSRTL